MQTVDTSLSHERTRAEEPSDLKDDKKPGGFFVVSTGCTEKIYFDLDIYLAANLTIVFLFIVSV